MNNFGTYTGLVLGLCGMLMLAGCERPIQHHYIVTCFDSQGVKSEFRGTEYSIQLGMAHIINRDSNNYQILEDITVHNRSCSVQLEQTQPQQ